MSESQRRGKKKGKAPEKKPEPVVAVQEEEVSLNDIFDEPKVPEDTVTEPEPKRPEAAKPKATKESPGIEVDIDKLLRFIARIKTGGFGLYGNGANFGNHMVKDCFKVDGKALSLEEASALVRPFTNVAG